MVKVIAAAYVTDLAYGSQFYQGFQFFLLAIHLTKSVKLRKYCYFGNKVCQRILCGGLLYT